MRGIVHFIIVLIFIGCISCEKKKYPESSVENEALFYVKGTVDYNPVNLVAGENDYYMYSSYSLDSNSIFSFAGEFKGLGCFDCRNTLEIRLRDYKAAPGGVPNPTDSSIKTGPYLYIDRVNDAAYTVSFEGSYTPPLVPSNVHWDFGDGSVSTQLNPTHTYQRAGKYTVCLTVNNENGCKGSICNEINVGETSFMASVISASAGDRAVQFAANLFRGRAPFKYLWNFGDGTNSTASGPLHTFKFDGSYPVTLTITDASGQTVVSNHHIVTKKDAYSCVPNTKITYFSTSKKVNSAGVILKWTDANGVVYTSDKTQQLVTSSFIIEKIEDFSANENMQKTKKLQVRFNCVMSDGKKAIPFTNAQAVICVAVP